MTVLESRDDRGVATLSQVIQETLQIAKGRDAVICKVAGGPSPVQEITANGSASRIWSLRNDKKRTVTARSSCTINLDLKLSVRPKQALLILGKDGLTQAGLNMAPLLVDHSMRNNDLSITCFNETSTDVVIQKGQRLAKVICIEMHDAEFLRDQL